MRTLKPVTYSQQNNVYLPRTNVKWQVVKSFAVFYQISFASVSESGFRISPTTYWFKVMCTKSISTAFVQIHQI